MPKKKLTFVVSHLVPTYGLERVVVDVVELLKAHFDIRVVQLSGADVPPEFSTGVPVLSVGQPLRGWRRIGALKRLRHRIPDDATDVYIIAGVWVAIPWLLAASPRQRRRSIIWEHSILRDRLRHSSKMSLLAVSAFALYRRAAGVIAVSSPVADCFRKLPRPLRPKRIWEVANPVPDPFDNPGSRVRGVRNPPYQLVSVGSLSKLKAQHLAVQSLVQLGPEYRLVLVGDGRERHNLEQLAEAEGVRDQVTFKGYLTQKEVRAELLKADLLVHCSVSETFGLVFAEAANLSLPVVAISNPVAELMIPRLVPGRTSPRDRFALAAAIEEEMATEVDHELNAASHRARVRSLSPKSVTAEWRNILDSFEEFQRVLGANTVQENH